MKPRNLFPTCFVLAIRPDAKSAFTGVLTTTSNREIKRAHAEYLSHGFPSGNARVLRCIDDPDMIDMTIEALNHAEKLRAALLALPVRQGNCKVQHHA